MPGVDRRAGIDLAAEHLPAHREAVEHLLQVALHRQAVQHRRDAGDGALGVGLRVRQRVRLPLLERHAADLRARAADVLHQAVEAGRLRVGEVVVLADAVLVAGHHLGDDSRQVVHRQHAADVRAQQRETAHGDAARDQVVQEVAAIQPEMAAGGTGADEWQAVDRGLGPAPARRRHHLLGHVLGAEVAVLAFVLGHLVAQVARQRGGGRDEVHRLAAAARGQPQHLVRADHVGRQVVVQRQHPVDQRARMADGIHLVSQLVELVLGQAEQRLGQVAHHRVQQGRVLRLPEIVFAQDLHLPRHGLLGVVGAHQAVGDEVGAQRLVQQEGADKAGGAGDEHRFGLRLHRQHVVELQFRLQVAATRHAVVQAAAAGRLLRRRAGLGRGFLAVQPRLGQLLQQELAQRPQVGMIEGDLGGQRQAGHVRKLVAQQHGGERVDADVLQRQADVHVLGRGELQRLGHLGAHRVQHRGLALLDRGFHQQLAQAGAAARATARAACARRPAEQLTVQRRGAAAVVVLQRALQAAEVERGGHGHRRVAHHGGLEQVQRLGRAQRFHALAAEARLVGIAQARGHALPVPRAPGHRGRRQALGAAVVRQRVQESVGGGVVALARRAGHAGDRREQHEEVQRQVLRQAMQVPGAVDLGREHVVEAFRRLAGQHAVVQHPGRVHHAAQRPVFAELAHDPLQAIGIGGVARHHGGAGAQFGQFGDKGLGVRRTHAAARGQHQITHLVVLHQPLRHITAQPAQAAGDQHRAVRIDHAAALRRHQHHLAHVAGLRDEAQRVGGAVQREGAQRQRLELALGEQRGDGSQHFLDAFDAGLRQVVDAVGHARMVGLDPGLVAQVDLAHLQEAPARLEHGEAGVDELARQRVEHDVEATARRRFREGLREIQAARGADVVIGQPQLAQRRPLRLAGGAVDLGAMQQRQLHRRHADAAGRGMHQHALARLHVAQHVQAVPCRQEGHGNGGGLLEAEVVRLGHDLARVHHDRRTEGAARQPQHRVARLEVLDGAADFRDHAGELQAEGRDFDHAQGVQHVQEVHPGGLDRGADLARRQRLVHQRLDRQRLVQAALGRDLQAPVALGRQHQAGVGGRLLQTRRQQLAAAQRALGLVLQRQRGRQRVQVGRGLAQVDDAQGQFGMLVARGAQQAPQGAGAQVGHRIVAAGADSAARHPDDGLGKAGQRQFLHLHQRAGGLAVRRLLDRAVAGPQLDHAIAGLGLAQSGDVDDLRAGLHEARTDLIGPGRVGAAQQAPGAAEHGLRRLDRLPFGAEQEAVDPGRRQAPQRRAVDAARMQALQPAHVLATGVVQVQRGPELALAQLKLRHLDPHFGQAVFPDRQALGLERNEHVVAHLRFQALGQQQRVHRGVQQRGMQAVADGRRRGRFRQRHPRPNVAVDVPGGIDALERRTVAIAQFMQVLVERGHVDRIAVRRRQLDRLLARGLGRRQLAFGVQLPFAVLVRFRRAVDVHRAGAARFRAHGDLHAQRHAGRQHHRRQDDHVGQVPLALDLPPRGAHGLEERRARHQHRVHHLVLPHPGRLVGRHHGGEHRHVGAGDLHAAAQQLVVGVVQAGADRARGHGFEPVALALEGVGGQLDTFAAIRGEEAAPVHRRAQHVQLGQALLQGLGLVLGRIERGHPGHRAVIGQAGRAHAGQHRLRAQFQEGIDALLVERAHAGVEAHRLARLLYPVFRLGHLAALGQLAGQAADQGQLRRGVVERLRHLAEGAQHRLQQMRVERVRDLQPLGLALLLLEMRHHLLDAGQVAGHHRLLRRVQARQRHLRGQAERGQGGLDLGRAGFQRGHAAAGRQGLHQAAARGHQAAGVVQVEHAGGMGRGDLADAVAQQQLGLHAPAFPHPPQRHFQREQGRLGEIGAVEQGSLGAAGLGEHHLQQRFFQRGEALRDVVQRLAEHRVGLVQAVAHARQLAALAGEQQGQAAFAVAVIDHADRARRHLAGAGVRG
ncbi:Uncharacterised protein [Achromobacter ruhlandii]|nr:Uncharacterised protein [Achromobacter ruhlandii]